jgi:hypothetical protein
VTRTETVYPYFVRSLAEGRSYPKHIKSAAWLLNVAGPFCPFPQSRYARLHTVGSSAIICLGRLLCCDLRFAERDGNVAEVRVIISSELKERLIKEEYAKTTGRKR